MLSTTVLGPNLRVILSVVVPLRTSFIKNLLVNLVVGVLLPTLTRLMQRFTLRVPLIICPRNMGLLRTSSSPTSFFRIVPLKLMTSRYTDAPQLTCVSLGPEPIDEL